MGFVDADGTPSSTGAGKLTRASLMMAVAAGVGVRPENVRSQAAAVELLHNATLLHDDIADADELRRGRPAVWKAFGTSLAIHAGNALQGLALELVVDDSEPGREKIARAFAKAFTLVHTGQARELTLRPGSGAGLATYEQMVKEKASALLEFSLTAPALRAGAPELTLAALRGAARDLGIALQVFNDVEDIWGDPDVTGKPIRGDIKRRNLTHPVLVALSADGPAGERLNRRWEADGTTDEHLQELADLIDETGGRRTAQDTSRRHLDSAVEHLGQAGLAPPLPPN
ncbi:polyprenyl synthetase family protein [Streptomyces sp. M10(2022)]